MNALIEIVLYIFICAAAVVAILWVTSSENSGGRPA